MDAMLKVVNCLETTNYNPLDLLYSKQIGDLRLLICLVTSKFNEWDKSVRKQFRNVNNSIPEHMRRHQGRSSYWYGIRIGYQSSGRGFHTVGFLRSAIQCISDRMPVFVFLTIYNLQFRYLADALNPERLTTSKVIHQ